MCTRRLIDFSCTACTHTRRTHWSRIDARSDNAFFYRDVLFLIVVCSAANDPRSQERPYAHNTGTTRTYSRTYGMVQYAIDDNNAGARTRDITQHDTYEPPTFKRARRFYFIYLHRSRAGAYGIFPTRCYLGSYILFAAAGSKPIRNSIKVLSYSEYRRRCRRRSRALRVYIRYTTTCLRRRDNVIIVVVAYEKVAGGHADAFSARSSTKHYRYTAELDKSDSLCVTF